MAHFDNSTVLFRCATCNFEESIPKDVVDFLDHIDGGDPAFPPRFDCSSCGNGYLYPVCYKSQSGIVYKL